MTRHRDLQPGLRSEFLRMFERAAWLALRAGGESVPVEPGEKPFRDNAHVLQFRAACNAGFATAQTTILENVVQIRACSNLLDGERQYQELALRKIIDAIACQMVAGRHHIVRRLSQHPDPQFVSSEVLLRDKWVIDKLNGESPNTFALMADLSTSIDVTDVLRVDDRNEIGELHFLELKEGIVNREILTAFSEIASGKPPCQTALSARPSHAFSVQASRILKQQTRMRDVLQVLNEDHGKEITTGFEIHVSEGTSTGGTPSYSHVLDSMWKRAETTGSAVEIVDECLTVGLVYVQSNPRAALQLAARVVGPAISAARVADEATLSIRKELTSLIPEKEVVGVGDPFISNLFSIATIPFTAWSVSPEFLSALVSQEAVLRIGFDLAAFIRIAREVGFDAELLTRRETEKTRKIFGRRQVPVWGNRALCLRHGDRESTMLGGMLSRFLVSTFSPRDFLTSMYSVRG